MLASHEWLKALSGVTISASETSTGVYHPMEEVSRVVRAHGALLAVDAITALGVHPLRMDAMGIDVLVRRVRRRRCLGAE